MRIILLIIAVAAFIALISCSSEKTKAAEEQEAAEIEKIMEIPEEINVQLTPVDGYFSTVKPIEVQGLLIKDQNEFDRNFHPAKTMINNVVNVDFSKSNVGAIIMPATEYDTEIMVNKSYVKGKTLYVYYSVKKADQKRSFSTVPQLLFTFNSSLAVDSIYIDK